MFIVLHRRLFFIITGIILAISVGAIAILGLPLSIDFKGGSLEQVTYTGARPALATLQAGVNKLALGEVSLRASGTNGVSLGTRTLTPAEHTAVLAALSEQGAAPLTEDEFDSVGPSLGAELGIKAVYALGAVILAIMLYIAFAFRRVSRPVSSWVYGLIVVVILVHDVLIPAGFYAILAHFTGAEVNSLFVVALLAILGYSVNDTIVIFDRVREHLGDNEEHHVKEEFDVTVGKSITQTLGRSINTSLTVVLALLALIFVGSPVTKDFALVLLVGVIAGTYSSILLAAPLLVPLAKRFAHVEVSGGKQGSGSKKK
ncbi:MAG TPA: protein translocase subunit SecF [Candidatus Paceibacterota bacterium]|jgi:preprotein translocase subunit SecF|nr:protein translocase subunit SecF [Candidatus Paceibacterota bacterium]